MLKLLFSLFGCSSTTKDHVISREIGPFTIQAITHSGKTMNMNYGMVNTSTTLYKILYNGQPLQLPDSPEKNTGVPGIWRVYHLVDAPIPALIFGSQVMYLVVEKNNRAEVTTLKAQYHDFASLQWLDYPDGQPGEFSEVFNAPDFEGLELRGGRLLAISKSLVLDVNTLELFPFCVEERIIDGYLLNGFSGALGLSPDSAQVIYDGVPDLTDANPKAPYGLICFNFKTNDAYTLLFDPADIHLQPGIKITPEYLSHYYSWEKRDNDQYYLAKRIEENIPGIGQLVYERYKDYIYEIYGVKEEMKPILSEFIAKTWNLPHSQIVISDEEYDTSIKFDFEATSFVLNYEPSYGRLWLEPADNFHPADASKSPVRIIGKGFNELLRKGEHQPYFIK